MYAASPEIGESLLFENRDAETLIDHGMTHPWMITNVKRGDIRGHIQYDVRPTRTEMIDLEIPESLGIVSREVDEEHVRMRDRWGRGGH